VTDAVRLIRSELQGRVPLIGFSGSPWTLATYMIEGGSSSDYRLAKGLMFQDPHALHRLLSLLADAVVAYLNAQIAAGAQAVMLFDTWGGVLGRSSYCDYSLRYMKQITDGLDRRPAGRRIPVILFSKGAGQWIERVADSGCDAVGLDWTADIGAARTCVGSRVALQGNLDPAVLYGGSDVIRREAMKIIESFGQGSGHVFNLGHGIHPGADPASVDTLVTAVHEMARPFHEQR